MRAVRALHPLAQVLAAQVAAALNLSVQLVDQLQPPAQVLPVTQITYSHHPVARNQHPLVRLLAVRVTKVLHPLLRLRVDRLTKVFQRLLHLPLLVAVAVRRSN